jgi:RimJ/RimL family protein N-acetyltransferase
MRVEPVALEGSHVRLEPLERAHFEGLCEVGLEPGLWHWTTTRVTTREEMRHYVDEALAWRAAGTAVPFATVERATGRVVGSTRFANIDREHRRAEIGWTWVSPPWQRTAVNTEAKLLMLAHAFDTWTCHRVELKTDALNETSRRAIGRLGAVEEGVLRHHMVVWDGRMRDTVYFSILAAEWPAVRAGLQDRLARAAR